MAPLGRAGGLVQVTEFNPGQGKVPLVGVAIFSARFQAISKDDGSRDQIALSRVWTI